jgi:micrococcal nuclease
MKTALIFLLFIHFSPVLAYQTDQGTVMVVYDGDTIKVKFDSGIERRVRLIGIDTPEIGDDPLETPLEALLAKRFTFYHLFRQRVKLTYGHELEDRYGRLLAYVWKEKVLFNQFILEQGFARVFLKFSYSLKEKFINAQKEAQEEGRGFWRKKPSPVITALRAKEHIGNLVRVSFSCARIRESGNLLFLQTQTGDFAAVIRKEYLSLFGEVQKLEGKTLEIFGFLEEYNGQPQIMLFSPTQINKIGVESQHLTFLSFQIFNNLNNCEMSNVETRPLSIDRRDDLV